MTQPLQIPFMGGVSPVYVEDVFSTHLYTGNGSTQKITNNIDLSGKGGMVWFKSRAGTANNPSVFDTVRGATLEIGTSSTAGDSVQTGGVVQFYADGIDIGNLGRINTSGSTYVVWAFRKQPKFFDIVTYTGTGANQDIPHNLAAVPGCVMVKRTDTNGNWRVYHNGLTSPANSIVLNLTSQQTSTPTVWNSTEPTSTVFTVGTDPNVNESGGTYVAYLFAHDAGGFGTTGTDNIISCGMYTGNGLANGPTVNLGYEPQWLLIRCSTSTGGAWGIYDNMRGITTGGFDAFLQAQSTAIETFATDYVDLNPTGFQIRSTLSTVNTSGQQYIYIAIRRGPMKTPTDATTVFSPVARTGTGVNVTVSGGFPTDLYWVKNRTSIAGRFATRMTSTGMLDPSSTGAEVAVSTTFLQTNPWDSMVGVNVGSSSTTTNGSGQSFINYLIKRAPGFFDVVCYTGTGANRTVSHNLGVAPELMIVKCRSTARNWGVYSAALGSSKFLFLNTTDAEASTSPLWNASPTATTFSVGGSSSTNANGDTYVAYLFATVAGVSKVGSYTGTGLAQVIDCGFTSGARFVLIKRTDTVGNWFVWDSDRGIVSGNDPYLILNTTSAEVTSTDYIDPSNSGFELSSTASAIVNNVIANDWVATSGGSGQNPNGMAYGNGVYVFVYSGGATAYSSNGTTLTLNTTFTINGYTGIAFGNGIFVAVGITGMVHTSTNGTTWTARSYSGTPPTAWYDVQYVNDRFVVVGSEGKFITSTDGITWSSVSVINASVGVRGVAYGNNVYVFTGAISTTPYVYTSTDLTSFTSRTFSSTRYVEKVTFVNGLFIAGSGDSAFGEINTSSDGITWANVFSSSTISIPKFAFEYINNIYVTVCRTSSSSFTVFSADAVNWNTKTFSGTNTIYSFKKLNGVPYLGLLNGNVSYSVQPTYIYLAIA